MSGAFQNKGHLGYKVYLSRAVSLAFSLTSNKMKGKLKMPGRREAFLEKKGDTSSV